MVDDKGSFEFSPKAKFISPCTFTPPLQQTPEAESPHFAQLRQC